MGIDSQIMIFYILIILSCSFFDFSSHVFLMKDLSGLTPPVLSTSKSLQIEAVLTFTIVCH